MRSQYVPITWSFEMSRLMEKTVMRRASASLLFALSLDAITTAPAFATTNLYTVCDSGCSYTNLQAAIDAVSSGSATSPWTISLLPGVYTVGSSISITNKSYLTITGYGDGASVLQASSSWFTGPSKEFLTIKDSNHINIRDITFDSTTNAPNNLVIDPTGGGFTGVLIDGSGDVRFEDFGVSAFQWGMKDVNLDDGDYVNVFSSRIVAQYVGCWIRGGTWYLWSSDVRADGTLTANPPQQYAIGLYLSAGYKVVTAWATYFLGETNGGGAGVNTVAGVWLPSADGDEEVSLVGCTLHGELTAIPTSGPGILAGFLSDVGLDIRIDLVGSEIVYEAPPSLAVGNVAGVYAVGGGAGTASRVNLTGTAIRDRARDGTGDAGLFHADVFRQSALGGTINNVRVVGSLATSLLKGTGTEGPSVDTIEMQTGSATFQSSNTLTVTLPVPLPNNKYQVALSVNAPQVVWVDSKTATNFTVRSNQSSSTATIDWIVQY